MEGDLRRRALKHGWWWFRLGFGFWVSLVAQTVKNLPAMWETQVQSLGWGNNLEKEMASPVVQLVKNPLASPGDSRDLSLIPVSG